MEASLGIIEQSHIVRDSMDIAKMNSAFVDLFEIENKLKMKINMVNQFFVICWMDVSLQLFDVHYIENATSLNVIICDKW